MGVDPISIGLMVGGTALSAFGSYEEGQAKASAYAYQSEVAKQNAGLAVEEGETAADKQSLKNRQLLGRMKANQAANGVDVNSGSAVDVRQAQAAAGAEDALTIRSNAARKASGFQNQAYLDEKASSDSAEAGTIKAFSSLLSGANDVYTKVGFPIGGSGNTISFNDGADSFDAHPVGA